MENKELFAQLAPILMDIIFKPKPKYIDQLELLQADLMADLMVKVNEFMPLHEDAKLFYLGRVDGSYEAVIQYSKVVEEEGGLTNDPDYVPNDPISGEKANILQAMINGDWRKISYVLAKLPLKTVVDARIHGIPDGITQFRLMDPDGKQLEEYTIPEPVDTTSSN